MLKPFDARVVVKKPQREEKTESGIFLPDTVNEQGQTALGEVLAVGPGSRNMNTGEPMPMNIELGDTIIYTKFSATEVQHKGDEYSVVTERDIIAVVEDQGVQLNGRAAAFQAEYVGSIPITRSKPTAQGVTDAFFMPDKH